MTALKSELLGILQYILHSPSSNVELVASLLLSIIAAIIALQSLSKLLNFPLIDISRASGVIIAGTIIVLGGACLANMYIVPSVTSASLKKAVTPIIAAILLLGAVTPLCCFLQKPKYPKAATSIILSLGAALIVSLFVNGAFSAFNSGNKDFGKAMDRKAKINNSLKQ